MIIIPIWITFAAALVICLMLRFRELSVGDVLLCVIGGPLSFICFLMFWLLNDSENWHWPKKVLWSADEDDQ